MLIQGRINPNTVKMMPQPHATIANFVECKLASHSYNLNSIYIYFSHVHAHLVKVLLYFQCFSFCFKSGMMLRFKEKCEKD
jgi:hypothetical protein